MLLTEKKARLKWNPANRKKYVELGYAFTAWKEEFLVEIKDITPTTRAIVFMECDYCGEEKEICYSIYCNKLKLSFTKKDTCAEVKCTNKKIIETNMAKYGTESSNASEEVKLKKIKTLQSNYGEEYTSAFQVPEIKEKIEKTNLLKYGSVNTLSNEGIQNKSKQTSTEKYGVICYQQTEEFKARVIQTSLERYGVSHPSKLESTKKKQAMTNLERYGVESVTQNEEIRQKQINTTREKYGVDYYLQTEEHKENMKGENHPNWRSDLTLEERETKRMTKEYSDWRVIVFERDDYTCQCCNERGNKLHAHHKDGYHWCTERRLDIDNGATLCEDCHVDFHIQYGRKNNTEAQYKEFLNNKL